jgi:hypothetical protein
MLTRRLFLAGAIAAPAIVRAESLMKLWVPRKRGVWVGWDMGEIRGDCTVIRGGWPLLICDGASWYPEGLQDAIEQALASRNRQTGRPA